MKLWLEGFKGLGEDIGLINLYNDMQVLRSH